MSFRALVAFSAAAAFLMFLSVALLEGCVGARAPREQARAVVLTVAHGVSTADKACAAVARGRRDAELAEECAALVDEAREQLLTAEAGVDAFDAAEAGRLPCALRAAATALERLLGTIQRAGGKTPPAVDDALRLAPSLAGACHG